MNQTQAKVTLPCKLIITPVECSLDRDGENDTLAGGDIIHCTDIPILYAWIALDALAWMVIFIERYLVNGRDDKCS